MITVRFPNGQAVQYNEGWFIEYIEHGFKIWESSKKERLNAFVPYSSGAMIEWIPACRVYNPLNRSDIDEKIAKELRAIKRKVGK